MRKVTREIVTALMQGKAKKVGNSETDGVWLKLHNNVIATKSSDSPVVTYTLSSAGWRTKTTKERLNGLLELLGAPTIRQRRGVWYIGEAEFEEYMKVTVDRGARHGR